MCLSARTLSLEMWLWGYQPWICGYVQQALSSESGAALSKSITYMYIYGQLLYKLIRTDGWVLIHIQLRQKQHDLEGQFTGFILHKGTLK